MVPPYLSRPLHLCCGCFTNSGTGSTPMPCALITERFRCQLLPPQRVRPHDSLGHSALAGVPPSHLCGGSLNTALALTNPDQRLCCIGDLPAPKSYSARALLSRVQFERKMLLARTPSRRRALLSAVAGRAEWLSRCRLPANYQKRVWMVVARIDRLQNTL